MAKHIDYLAIFDPNWIYKLRTCQQSWNLCQIYLLKFSCTIKSVVTFFEKKKHIFYSSLKKSTYFIQLYNQILETKAYILFSITHKNCSSQRTKKSMNLATKIAEITRRCQCGVMKCRSSKYADHMGFNHVLPSQYLQNCRFPYNNKQLIRTLTHHENFCSELFVRFAKKLK